MEGQYVAGSVSSFVSSKRQTVCGASTHHVVLEGEKIIYLDIKLAARPVSEVKNKPCECFCKVFWLQCYQTMPVYLCT